MLGYRERQSHRIVDVGQCPILDPALSGLLEPVRHLLSALLKPGHAIDVQATLLKGGIDLMLIGPLDLSMDCRERLAAFAEQEDIARLSHTVGEGADAEPIAWRQAVSVRFGSAAVVPPPGGFLQPTADGQAAITATVLDAIADADRVADFYAGCGAFTFPIADTGARVHAVEGNAAALAALRTAAGGNPRVTCEQRDLAADSPSAVTLDRYRAVVFDPPRAGAASLSRIIAASKVATVVAVSCNPATFARDARRLREGGYRLARLDAVDQFLWSDHVELVAVFRR